MKKLLRLPMSDLILLGVFTIFDESVKFGSLIKEPHAHVVIFASLRFCIFCLIWGYFSVRFWGVSKWRMLIIAISIDQVATLVALVALYVKGSFYF